MFTLKRAALFTLPAGVAIGFFVHWLASPEMEVSQNPSAASLPREEPDREPANDHSSFPSSEESDPDDEMLAKVGGPFDFTRTLIATTRDADGPPVLNLKLTGQVEWKPSPQFKGQQEFKVLFSQNDRFPSKAMVRFNRNPKGRLGPSGGAAIQNLAVVSEGLPPELVARMALDLLDQIEFSKRRDIQGRYLARFQSNTKAQTIESVKIKTRYLDGPYALAQITQSRARRLIQNRELISIQSSEQIQAAKHSPIAWEAKSEFDLLRSKTSQFLAFGATSQTWKSVDLKLALALSPQSTDRVLASEQPSLQSLLRFLGGVNKLDSRARLAYFRQLARGFRYDPEAAALARAAMKETLSSPTHTPPDPEQFRVLVGAIASSGRGDCESTLIGVVQSTQATPLQRQVVMNSWITTDAELSKETSSFLKTLIKNENPNSPTPVVSAAYLALGAQIAKTADPAEKDSLLELLRTQLQTAPNRETRLRALDAIGNSGSTELLALVRPYLHDGDESVRSHAYLALRLMPGTEALSLLDTGKSDSSSAVRQAVSRAYSLRNSDS